MIKGHKAPPVYTAKGVKRQPTWVRKVTVKHVIFHR